MTSSGFLRIPPIGTVPKPSDSAATVAASKEIPASVAPTKIDSSPSVTPRGASLSSAAILARLKSAQKIKNRGAWSIHAWLPASSESFSSFLYLGR